MVAAEVLPGDIALFPEMLQGAPLSTRFPFPSVITQLPGVKEPEPVAIIVPLPVVELPSTVIVPD